MDRSLSQGEEGSNGGEMNYFEHLVCNWRVAAHSLNDTLEHFLHGLFPFIKWEHKQKK